MDKNIFRAKAILEKYRKGECTAEEKAWVEDWYINLNSDGLPLQEPQLAEDLEALKARLDRIGRNKTPYFTILAVAATISIIGFIAAFYMQQQKTSPVPDVTDSRFADISPGGNKAELTLGDGRKIDLTDLKDGTSIQGIPGISVHKDNKGLITYLVSNEVSGTEQILSHSISTPLGGQFKVALSDGTTVFLNAGSTLKYPSRFPKYGERIVDLSGEAYFEVSKDRSRPFIVRSNGQQVKVLGTHFNISAYPDEQSIGTTLLEGSVRVSNGSKQIVLKPGEQSIKSADGLTKSKADTAIAIAWKNGKIAFKRTDIRQALREICRWYDLQLTYEGIQPTYTITGEVPRQSNLSSVLHILKMSGVSYKLKGRQLIVNN